MSEGIILGFSGLGVGVVFGLAGIWLGRHLARSGNHTFDERYAGNLSRAGSAAWFATMVALVAMWSLFWAHVIVFTSEAAVLAVVFLFSAGAYVAASVAYNRLR